MCDPERLLASKDSGANIHYQITYAPLEIRPSPVQPVSEINLVYFWPFFVSLSHFLLPQVPVSSASSSLSLNKEHIGGVQAA